MGVFVAGLSSFEHRVLIFTKKVYAPNLHTLCLFFLVISVLSINASCDDVRFSDNLWLASLDTGLAPQPSRFQDLSNILTEESLIMLTIVVISKKKDETIY